MKADVPLPPELAEEVLCQYADVLRVGCVTLNGERISWDTSASNGAQLEGFCSAFVAALRKRPELDSVLDADLGQAVHWFCKSVSINYALAELLLLLQMRIGEQLGAVCSVRTCGPDGRVLVDYSVDITPERKMLVRVSWRGKGNIISCNPRTAKRTVSGTLSSVTTEFPIPLGTEFKPIYSIDMKLKERPSQLMSKAVKVLTGRHKTPLEEVSPAAPLRSRSSLSSVDTPSTVSTLNSSGMATERSSYSDESDAEDVAFQQDQLFSAPLTLEVNTVRAVSGRLGGAMARPTGLIHL